jgi:hypothetical protein
MTGHGADRSARTVWCASLLVAVIFLLPPLVRATGHPLSARDTSSSFRLNRGFDKPEPKRTLTPPTADSADRAARSQQTIVPPGCAHRAAALEVPLSQQHRPSVDPQRGPPAHLIS